MSKMRLISTLVFMAFVISLAGGCKSKAAKRAAAQGA